MATKKKKRHPHIDKSPVRKKKSERLGLKHIREQTLLKITENILKA